jgi:hypothetical protein
MRTAAPSKRPAARPSARIAAWSSAPVISALSGSMAVVRRIAEGTIPGAERWSRPANHKSRSWPVKPSATPSPRSTRQKVATVSSGRSNQSRLMPPRGFR